MSYFFYKYLIIKAFVKNKKTSLYFTKFILKLYRYVPFVLKLAALGFRFWKSSSSYLFSKFYLRLWLIFIYHMIISYQLICSLRILFDYYSINLNETNRFIKTIYEMTEPYFDFIQKTLPKNAIGSIFGFYFIWVLSFLLKKVYLIIGKYYSNSDYIILTDTLLLLRAVSDEKIVFN